MLDHNTLPQFKKVDEKVFFKQSLCVLIPLLNDDIHENYNTVLHYLKTRYLFIYSIKFTQIVLLNS